MSIFGLPLDSDAHRLGPSIFCVSFYSIYNVGSSSFCRVMENVLGTEPLAERYDLKGTLSTSPLLSDVERQPVLPPLLNDVDYVVRETRLALSSDKRMDLLAQITSDCTYLQHQGIMDYSCLVGIRRVPAGSLGSVHLPNSRHAVMSEDRAFVYYIGFVDMLQNYSWGWKLQNFLLSLCCDRRRITALPPSEYAFRFLNFTHTYLLSDSRHKRDGGVYGSYGSFT